MFIGFGEYKRLLDSDQIRQNLEQEVKRLAELISAEVKDCKVGPWCNGCKHIGKENADLPASAPFGPMYIKEKAGRVIFCKKHLHEICPEFESAGA